MKLTEWQSISLKISKTLIFAIVNLLFSIKWFLRYFASLIAAFISSWFSDVLKIWYESRRCQLSIQVFLCFRDSLKLASWYIDLRCSFLIFLSLFFQGFVVDIRVIGCNKRNKIFISLRIWWSILRFCIENSFTYYMFWISTVF